MWNELPDDNLDELILWEVDLCLKVMAVMIGD